jgi:hypothetical protein
VDPSVLNRIWAMLGPASEMDWVCTYTCTYYAGIFLLRYSHKCRLWYLL